MQTSSRFAVAIHVLAFARLVEGSQRSEVVTSEQFADSVNTNPVVIRRVLGTLRDAGLVTSQPGPGGGWRLAKPATDISLHTVYEALGETPLFPLPQREPNRECEVGKRMPKILETCFREAEEAMVARLALVSIEDVVQSIMSEYGFSSAAELLECKVGRAVSQRELHVTRH